MATLVSDVTATIKRRFLTGQREGRNSLASTLLIGASSATFTYSPKDTGIQAGSILSCELERMRVADTPNDNAKTANIWRAEDGTTAIQHASGTPIYVNARLDDFDCLSAINDVLDSLSARGVVKITHVDLTYDSSLVGYNLTSVSAMLGRPLAVQTKAPGSSLDWLPLRRWRFQGDEASGDFASTRALFLDEAAYQGQTVRVWYAAPFTHLTTLAQDVNTISGLPSTATDLLWRGAILNLSDGREIKRNFTEPQGDSKRAQEVPAGAVQHSTDKIEKRYNERVLEEAKRIRRDWPQLLPRHAGRVAG